MFEGLAYPGLRVDVATDVDHVLEGLCVSRRHGQLRVAMGTERGVPIKTSSGARLTGQGFQGFRVSEFPLISAGGTPRGALCAACCASETLAARLGSAEVFGDDDPGCRRETPAKRHADGAGKSTTYFETCLCSYDRAVSLHIQSFVQPEAQAAVVSQQLRQSKQIW